MVLIDDFPQFAILAPRRVRIPQSTGSTIRDEAAHRRLLREMQKLRQRVAFQEGVTGTGEPRSGQIREEFMPGDDSSWHLLRLLQDGSVAGCARILVHSEDVLYTGLRLASMAIANSSAWSRHVREAVEADLNRARRCNLTMIEPGGWVVSEALRGTGAAVSLALGAFAWAQLLGDCIAFVTATVQHRSSAILRRLGGRSLEVRGEVIPHHFEPDWGCDMELLRFDTYSLNPRFGTALAALRSQLLSSPIIACS
jgi:hypothetical protein